MDRRIFLLILLGIFGRSKSSLDDGNQNVELNFIPGQINSADQLPSPSSPSLSPTNFYVHISQLPRRVFDKGLITLSTKCPPEYKLILELTISTEAVKEVAAFRKSVQCEQKLEQDLISMSLRLPRYLAFRPSHHNKYSIFVEKASIRSWLSPVQNSTDFKKSRWSDEIHVHMPHPYDLPTRPMTMCPNWLNNILWQLPYRPICKLEQEILHAVEFPVALSGFNTGVHRSVSEYHSLSLRSMRIANYKKPKFTFVMWIFVTDYCPLDRDRCSVLQHLIWNDNYASPRIHINQKGRLIIEIVMENGDALDAISNPDQIIPKYKWTKLAFTCTHIQCEIYVDYGTRIWRHILIFTPDDILFFDDVTGVFVFGGSEIEPSFKGYIGQATYYRRKVLSPDMIKEPRSDHAMFELGLNERESRCNIYLQLVNHVIYQTQMLLDSIIDKKTCINNDSSIFFPEKLKSITKKKKVPTATLR